ncbi:hypothetical protein CYLTODRAFT_489844 [Cylindrobasidium torrendii FP15055 ss-10]|uniref:F-box domain-containing protein n=1 Tax=Cylindrobasidium torrendii FP15055 ss-10 TaxID=1314674 RepID=A0A0D7BFH1_9AGAR|nr:hypothetical protein CYLTODRAFT_489844 [Cylindrobasidium torrendii FP15055 ss-10]
MLRTKRSSSSLYRSTQKRSPALWMSKSRSLPFSVVEAPPIVPCSVGLPPELLQIIFAYATSLPYGYEQSLWNISYTAFQDSGWSRQTSTRDRERFQVWQIKSTLSLVCKSWYALALEFLLEELRVGPYLPHPEVLATHGHWIHRLEILPSAPSDVRMIDILRMCPHIQIISKPSGDVVDGQFWDGLQDLAPGSLPYLRRLDWGTDSTTQFGSRQAFAALVAAAPNLYHLNSSLCVHPELCPPSSSLLNLRVLRFPPQSEVLNSIAMPITLPLAEWTSHVVVSPGFVGSMSRLVNGTTFPHVYCVELQDGTDLVAGPLAQLQRLFPRCTELAFSPYHVGRVNLGGQKFSFVKRLRLYANPNGLLVDLTPWIKYNYDELMDGFPALEEVVMHGDWRFVLSSTVMDSLADDLGKRSCRLVAET